ncbi:hypothetical protein PR002_g15777 [Phytophthora rubi]|uniref:Uncharacterized protein n=1 Tax=Phytophthora rubi TaxID=129364 RepID=A0A6A3KZB2_9STRA|nr:hypothetical protein PR002_g15777 [Phytophthora rubi]
MCADLIGGGLTEPGTAELPELDPFFMKVQFIVNSEMLVVHPCAKLVESMCPGYGKVSCEQGQMLQGQAAALLRALGGADRGEE